MNLINKINAASLCDDIPSFRPGNTLRVHIRVVKGSYTRVQALQGVVIARQGGGVSEALTIRKVSFGVGVKHTFPVHTPSIKKIRVVAQGQAHRAKLCYLRNLHGKAAEIKEHREG